jgi:hypothetical protein
MFAFRPRRAPAATRRFRPWTAMLVVALFGGLAALAGCGTRGPKNDIKTPTGHEQPPKVPGSGGGKPLPANNA